MKFEVKSGIHTDGKGRTYRKGEIVDSTSNLEARFLNKFQRRVDLEQLEAAGLLNKVTPKARLVASITPAEKTEKKTPPALDDEDEPEVPEKKDEEDEDEDDIKTNKTGVTSSLGADVTESFDEAKKAEFIVLRNAKGLYHIASPDKPDEALHPKPLIKANVIKTVRKLING